MVRLRMPMNSAVTRYCCGRPKPFPGHARSVSASRGSRVKRLLAATGLNPCHKRAAQFTDLFGR